MVLSQKYLCFVKIKLIYTQFALVVPEPYITVIIYRLFFTQNFILIFFTIRTPKNEYFELSHSDIAL